MKKKITPAQIHEAAIHIFAKYGFKKTRVDDIAQELGVVKGTIYRYVKDKDELYISSIAHGLSQWMDQATSAAMAVDDPAEQLKVYTIEGYSYLESHPDLRTILINDPTVFPISHKEDPFFEINHAAMGELKQILRRGIQSGRFKELDVDAVAEFLFSIYIMYIIKTYVKSENQSMQSLINSGFRVILDGILN